MANNEVGLTLVVDESNVSSELKKISNDLGQIESDAQSTEASLNNAFKTTKLRAYENQTKRAAAANDRLDNSVKRTTRSQSRNVRATNAATSAISRYIGVNNKAISGIRGVGTAMAATPVGIFIAGFTTAATVMEYFGFSLFETNSEMEDLIESTKKLNEETEKLNKQNEQVAQRQLIERLKAQGATVEEVAEATAKGIEKIRAENFKTLNDLTDKENDLVEQIVSIRSKLAENESRLPQSIKDQLNARIAALVAEKDLTIATRTKISLENQKLNIEELEEEVKQNERRSELAKKRRENAIKEQNRLSKELKAIQEKILKEEIKTRLELLIDGEQKEIEEVKQQAEERQKTVNNLFNRQLEIITSQATKEEQLNGELDQRKAELAKQQSNILTGIEQKKQNDIKEIRSKFRAEEKADFKSFLDNIINQSLDNLKKQLDTERLKLSTQQELDKKRFFEVQRTEKEIADFKEGQNQARLRAEIDLQVQILEAVLKAGKQKSKIEKDLIKAQIEELKAQKENIGLDESAPEKTSFLQSIGIDISPDAQKAAIDELKKVGALVFDELSKQAQQRAAIAAEQIQNSERELDRLGNNLDREIRLLENGDAANIERQRMAIAEQEEIRKKAIEDQKKAQQAQFALDTASQTVNLITASTEIFKNLSSGFPYTLPLAIGAVAAMFGAFAASRTQAAKAVGLADGGIIPLGRDDRQEASKGYRLGNTNLFLGGGEYVTPVDKTRNSIQLLKAIHRGDLSDVDLNELHEAKNNKLSKSVHSIKKQKREIQREVYKEAVREAIKDQTSELGQYLKTLVNKPTIIQLPNGTVIKEFDDGKGNKKRVEIKGG